MGKIIFEFMDYKETPNGQARLSIEMRIEPANQHGKAKKLADKVMDVIDEFKKTGNLESLEVHRY